MGNRFKISAGILAIMCGYNVLLHGVIAAGAWEWFTSRGVVLVPAAPFELLPHHVVWTLYWLVGFALAGYLAVTATRNRHPARFSAIALTWMCLFDVVLHAFDLHGLISYAVVSRDEFWTGYWAIAVVLCFALLTIKRHTAQPQAQILQRLQ